MSDKATWLAMIDRRARREANLSVFVKCALLVIIFFSLQILNHTIAGFVFVLCMCVMCYFINVLVLQKEKEYEMLYKQACKTPDNDLSFVVEPHYDAIGRKAGKADFLSVCADWKLIAYYAFLFVLNLALLITVIATAA